jgi:hypothetical protein
MTTKPTARQVYEISELKEFIGHRMAILYLVQVILTVAVLALHYKWCQ